MRIILVGAPAERARLRRSIDGRGLTVVGEADTIDAAREGVAADAWLIAARGHDGDRLEPAVAGEQLTPREREVLELLAQGLPNKTIALRLDISDQTVKFHVASICGKLGASNRTAAVHRALQRGILSV